MGEIRTTKSIDDVTLQYYFHHVGNETIFMHTAASTDYKCLLPISFLLNQSGYSTIIPDPRSQGGSEDAQNHSLEMYVNDVEKIKTDVGIRQMIPFGYSTGFMVMAEYLKKAQNSNILIGVCPSHNFHETNNMTWWFDRVFRFWDYVGSTVRHLHPFKNQSKLKEPFIDLKFTLAMTAVPYSRIQSYVKAGHEMLSWDISDTLRDLDARLLVHIGKQDKFVKYTHFKNRFEPIVTHLNPTYQVYSGSHSLPLQYPKEIAENTIHHIKVWG